jgi:hypothetical protein
MNPKISADHLKRRAIIYIRQSSPGQVIHNQESQRRQGRDNRRGSWTLWLRASGAPRIPASGRGSLHGTGWRRALH